MSSNFLVFFSALFFLLLVLPTQQQLSKTFYEKQCPKAEGIVRAVVTEQSKDRLVVIFGILRIFFHDCMVEGCDGSILMKSGKKDAERDALPNFTLPPPAFDAISLAKRQVEAVCPGVVSCADILAMAARDSVVLAGVPYYDVDLGRRDGFVSQQSRVHGNLPEPEDNFDKILPLFTRNNLSKRDLVALSGAHSVGISHCTSFKKRLYDFSSQCPVDPSLDKAYAKELMNTCTPTANSSVFVPMDPDTVKILDNNYFKLLTKGKGLFTSDQDLFFNPETKSIVLRFAENQTAFYEAFVMAMNNLGKAGVKTGTVGQVRLEC